jgi:hypothetical protein
MICSNNEIEKIEYFTLEQFIEIYEKYIMPNNIETPANYKDVLTIIFEVYFCKTNVGVILIANNKNYNADGFIKVMQYVFHENVKGNIYLYPSYSHKHIEWEYYFEVYKDSGMYGVVEYLRQNSYTKINGEKKLLKPYLYYPDFGSEFVNLFYYGDKVDLITQMIKNQYNLWSKEKINHKKHKFIATSKFDIPTLRTRYAEVFDMINEMCIFIDLSKPVDNNLLNKASSKHKPMEW